MSARLALLLVAGTVAGTVAGCAATRTRAPESLAPTALTFPSELTRGSALSLARNTLRRAGWRAPSPAGDTLTTAWRETDAGPLRLVVSAADTNGGASTLVTVHGEVRLGEAAVPVRDGPGAAWATVEAAARHVGAEVRYARP